MHCNRIGLGLVLGLVLLIAADAFAYNLIPRATDFAAKYQAFTLIHGPQRRMVYATYTGTLHLLESVNNELRTTRKRELWSPMKELLAVDLDGDGQDELVGFTRDNRLLVMRGTDLGDIWITPEGRYRDLKALCVGDVDDDGNPELVFIADGFLRIFTALQDTEEWKSDIEFPRATDIEIGDVDNDQVLDIVFNSGLVVGAIFRDVKWTNETPFGDEIDLFDIDQDGILEIIGVSGGVVRIFDGDERRLKFD
jgi:hypothetical protein